MSKETEQKQVQVELDNEVRVNGVAYGVGTHKVPAELAEDLVRMNKDHNKYLVGLNQNNKSNGSLGSVSAA